MGITMTKLMRKHCSVLDDAFAQLRSGSKTVTIPNDLWKEIMDEALKGGHPDNPGEKGALGVISGK